MNVPRLAIIGSGTMATQHVLAAREAGFLVHAVASRPNSQRVADFARTHEIDYVFSNPWELIESPDWDALIVAVPEECSLPYAMAGTRSERWVLAEKPLSLDPIALNSIHPNAGRLVVGYNRRFYSTVNELKSFIDEGGPCLMQMSVPERIPTDAAGKGNMSNIVTNSVHMLDLSNYLLGNAVSTAYYTVRTDYSYSNVVVVEQTDRGHMCTQVFSWNAVANFSLTVDRGDTRLVLAPIETLRKYRGMDIGLSSPGSVLRTYHPRLVGESQVSVSLECIKPGMVEQAREFIRLVRSEISAPIDLATSIDAYHAQRNAGVILDFAVGGRSQ